MSPGDLLPVDGAGLLGGAVNGVSGGGSLLTFRALLGGTNGVRAARRLPGTALRPSVVVLGTRW